MAKSAILSICMSIPWPVVHSMTLRNTLCSHSLQTTTARKWITKIRRSTGTCLNLWVHRTKQDWQNSSKNSLSWRNQAKHPTTMEAIIQTLEVYCIFCYAWSLSLNTLWNCRVDTLTYQTACFTVWTIYGTIALQTLCLMSRN
eukprot:27636_5